MCCSYYIKRLIFFFISYCIFIFAFFAFFNICNNYFSVIKYLFLCSLKLSRKMIYMRYTSQHGTRNLKTHNKTTQKTIRKMSNTDYKFCCCRVLICVVC